MTLQCRHCQHWQRLNDTHGLCYHADSPPNVTSKSPTFIVVPQELERCEVFSDQLANRQDHADTRKG